MKNQPVSNLSCFYFMEMIHLWQKILLRWTFAWQPWFYWHSLLKFRQQNVSRDSSTKSFNNIAVLAVTEYTDSVFGKKKDYGILQGLAHSKKSEILEQIVLLNHISRNTNVQQDFERRESIHPISFKFT